MNKVSSADVLRAATPKGATLKAANLNGAHLKAAGLDKNPQVLRIARSHMLRGFIPAMPQSCAVLHLEVRPDKIKRLDIFHDLPAVRGSLAPLCADRLGMRLGSGISAASVSSLPRHVLEQLSHLLMSVQESAGLTLFAQPLVASLTAPASRKAVWTARLLCPAPQPAMLLKLAPDIIKILNCWLAGRGFEALPATLETLIAEMVKVAPTGQNARLLLDAARRLDVPSRTLFGRTVQLGWGARSRWMDSSVTDETSAISTRIARDKRAAARFLAAHGVPVPRQVDAPTLEAALGAVSTVGFPLVVKPANLDGGIGVTANIMDEVGLRRAYEAARRVSQHIIIEAHQAGRDYRLGVAHGEIAWISAREPAGVHGDGMASVQQLIDRANQDPRRGIRKWCLMSPLSVDEEARDLLIAQALSLDDVPVEGRFVQLRSAANISSGGVPTGAAHLAHPDNKALAIRAARLMRLDIAGIDLIMPDISKSWREVGGAICEVNAQPQFSVSQLVAPFKVVGGLFEGDGRIPVIVILGKAENVRAPVLLEAFRAKGLRLGLALPNDVSVDGGALKTDGGGAFSAVQALLIDPCVDAVIALVDDESWLGSGSPFDSIDLLLCTPDASPKMKSLLSPLQRIGVRPLEDQQLVSRQGADAMAAEVAGLRDWHDSRALPVERVASAALSASPYGRTAPARPGSIGLCMIAKDEAAIIRESLDSVRDLVDFVLVEDTGSTDGTQQVVRDWLAENGVAGEVIETPWRDFAWNRSCALAHLRAHHDIDYALILDADDLLKLEAGLDVEEFKAGLTADIYDLDIEYGGLRFSRPQLLRNAKAFGYRGVLHEYVEVPANCVGRSKAQGLHVQARSRGARSRNARKYQDDAALLEAALQSERDPRLRSRYLFYLAQSYEDGRRLPDALTAYLERAAVDFWSEERFVAAYRAARLMGRLNHPPAQVEAAFRRAISIAPHRKEAYHGLARYLRLRQRHDEAFEIGRAGLDASRQADPNGLFVEARIFAHGLLEEVALAASLCGRHQECAEYCAAILSLSGLPERVRAGVDTLLASAGRQLDGAAPISAMPVPAVAGGATRPARAIQENRSQR